MKKVMFIMILVFAGITSVNAQKGREGEKDDRREKMQELKKAYFQENLDLSESESAKFWPMYDKHNEDKKALKKSMKEMKRNITDNESLTEADYVKYLDDMSDMRIKEVNMDKQYKKEVLSTLGLERTMKMKSLEKDFRKKMREKRDERKGKGDRGLENKDRPKPMNDN